MYHNACKTGFRGVQFDFKKTRITEKTRLPETEKTEKTRLETRLKPVWL
jgi:hypothetical protein